MLILASTSDVIRVVTSAAASIHAQASWFDNASGTISTSRTNTAVISTATTTTVVGSPGASTKRSAETISLRNAHASVTCDVTVEHFDGTTAASLIKATLLAGESLILDEEGAWTHYGATGEAYTVAELFVLTDAATIVVDASRGKVGQVTLAGNRTMGVPSNPVDEKKLIFRIKQDGTGGRTVTWTTGAGGYLGTLDLPLTEIVLGRAGANSYDYAGFIYNLALNRWVLMAVNLGAV